MIAVSDDLRAHRAMRQLAWLRGMPQTLVIGVALLLVGVMAALDRVTGPDLSVVAGYLGAVLLVTCVAARPLPDLFAVLSAVGGVAVSMGQRGAAGLGTEIGSGASRFIVLEVAVHLGSQLLATLDSLERAATTDPLTGLLNRRGLGQVLDAAIAQADRRGTPIAVAAFDLDGLKEVNDGLGHDAGDEMIIRFAELLVQIRRAGDHVARVGGDEFVVVLPDVDGTGAQTLVRRLAAAPDCPPFGHGVAEHQSGGQDDAQSLFQAADLALVADKRTRRGRVTG